MLLSSTAQRALDAYGGAALWSNATDITAEVSASGLAFFLKRRPKFDHVHIELKVQHQYIRITPIGNDLGYSGVLDGDTVHIENSEGKILRERYNPRVYFPYGRRLFYWDDLDMTYFAGYAFWNYFTFPALLLRNDIKWSEKESGILQAAFTPTLHTHSRDQEFRIDMSTGQLRRHNYVAEVISKLATAAQVVQAHSRADGLLFPSHRVVTPMRKNGGVRPGPILIDILVHAMQVR